jgi:glycosyltransferase involved in cell wall biosynthesis
MNTAPNRAANPIKLVYLIGTYPELTNTFIDREIASLRCHWDLNIQIVSLRYPRTIESFSPEQKALFNETMYLIPARWSGFNYAAFILANLFFALSRPLVYFGTLFDLLAQTQGGFKAWMMTLFYFWQGVYAAYLLRNTAFDHLHVHFMDRAVLVALVVGRFLGKPYSFTAHAADIYTHAAHVREKIEHASFVITVSQYNKQHFVKEYPGIDANKIHILHPWVDVSKFVPTSDHPAHDCLHVLSVGRLVEKKGHLDLIEAFYELREKGLKAECRIVGDGPLFTELQERIDRRGLQDCVQLVGGLPQNQVMGLLNEWADVFVLPCVIAGNGDRDGIPVSLAEAMAMELPVISTDIVGIRELVQPGTGILVNPHDPIALAEALLRIASQGQTATASMGRKAREVVDREFNLLKGTQLLAGYFHHSVESGLAASKEKVKHVFS